MRQGEENSRRGLSGRVGLMLLALGLGLLSLGAAKEKPKDTPGNFCWPVGVVIHHSASPARLGKKPVQAKEIDAWHDSRGFKVVYEGKVYHIGYHYVILPDGTVQAGRPEYCQGAHVDAWGMNHWLLGICLVGNFSTRANPDGKLGPARPSPAQMKALVGLLLKLQEKHPLFMVLRHKDLNPDTECPGDRFPYQDLLKRLAEAEKSSAKP